MLSSQERLAPIALIVEDDPHVATIFAAAFEEAGYVTEIIHDGAAARDRLADWTPAVIALDLYLPSVSGTEILRHIRANGIHDDTRVILVTADARLATEYESLADLVLIKPISFGQLSRLAERFRPA